MLYIKKYSGFIISIVIGLLLYEEANYAYTYRAATAYSDHMIYRLIARALITDAKYILADEPTGNLDKENRRKIVELLQQIAHEQDRCVIVVTHSDYVKKKCDICYEMGDDDEE